MTIELATATPVEIDTVLADIWGRAAQADAKAGQLAHWLSDACKAHERYQAGDLRYSSMQTAERITDLEDKLGAARAEAMRIWAEATPYNAEYERRGRWTRAYLVNNSNGHVHRTMNCETTYATTAFVWLPEYSGADAEQVVTDAGALTCLVCYGSVRATILANRGVDPTAQKTRIEAPARRAARLEREQAAAARKAKAEIAGIVDADTGGELRVKWLTTSTEVLRTLRTARTWLTDSYDGYTRDAGDLAKVTKAVAAKEGKTEAAVTAEARKRAAKRQ